MFSSHVVRMARRSLPVAAALLLGAGFVATPVLSATAPAKYTVAAPAAPARLEAKAAGPTSVLLTWADSLGATKYIIQLKDAKGAWVTIGHALGSAKSHLVTGGSPSHTYAYRIAAENAGGTSPFSDEATATTDPRMDTSVPKSPVRVRAHVLSETSVRVTWAGGSVGAREYIIERKSGSGAFEKVGTVNASERGFVDTALPTRVEYTYRVAAQNLKGTSPYSNESSVTPGAPTKRK